MTVLLGSEEVIPLRQAIVLVSLLLLPVAATAHHSRVEYIGGPMHEIEGEVIRVVWRNPHIMMTVRTVTEQGTEVWVLEGPGAGPVRHEGLVDGYISVGDHVRAAGQRSDRREDWLRLAHVLGPSGTELVFTNGGPRWSTEFVGGSREVESVAAADVALPDGMFRVWIWTGGTPYEINELPPLTPEAMAAYQAYDPLADDPALECNLPRHAAHHDDRGFSSIRVQAARRRHSDRIAELQSDSDNSHGNGSRAE